MDIKLLLKALKFACLPTLSVLVLLICGFFSITKAIAWISSDQGFAITIRVLLVIAEIALIWYMYSLYVEEEKLKKMLEGEDISLTPIRTTYDKYLYNMFNDASHNDTYQYFHTSDQNVKLVKRIPR